MTRNVRLGRREAGFTLVELLVVVAIIAVLAAISVPAIGQYIRNYKIRGAAQQVAGEIGATRNRAITRNTNLGVLFVAVSDTTYRWVIQDDPTAPGVQRDLATLMANPAQAGPLQSLPLGVQFDGTGATIQAIGFNRLGAQCQAGTRNCGSLTGAPAARYIVVDAAGQATLTLLQPMTSLRRTVTVTPGGRVLAQP